MAAAFLCPVQVHTVMTMHRPATATGRPKLQLVASNKPPTARRGWSGRMNTQGTSGTAPRQSPRPTNPECSQFSWHGLAAHYVNTGLPELSKSRANYKVGGVGYTADGFVAMAYQHAFAKLNHGERIEVTFHG